jgi:hypothetical protein
VRIVLDLDATNDPLYGEQEGRHFYGYYDCYCYLPLYIFSGRHLLAAKLRSSAHDAADGAAQEVARIVGHIRQQWPRTTIVIRADSGFCRDDLMSWCEGNGVQFVLGMASNERGEQPALTSPMSMSHSARPAFSTRSSTASAARWRTASRSARVICSQTARQPLRCERTSCGSRCRHSLTSSCAGCAASGLPGPNWSRATGGTIRRVLLKLGARVTISVRRVKLAFASSFPKVDVFERPARRLCT